MHLPPREKPAIFTSVNINVHARQGADLARLAAAFLLAACALAAPENSAQAHESSEASHQERYPLHSAAQGGDLENVKYFLTEHNIHPNTPGFGRNAALHYAAQRHPAIVNHLLAVGANVNAVTYSSSARYSSETPLHRAARASGTSYSPCLPEVILTLIAAGANVNAEDGGGQTPLYEALKESDGVDCPDVAVALIEAGGDTSPFRTDGSSPQNDSSPLYMLARNARGENELKPTRALIKRGDDVNDGGFSYASTPLYTAWRNARIGCSGCDPVVNPTNWYGFTDLLIENGAHYGLPCEGELATDPRPSSSLRSLPSSMRQACVCPSETHTEVNGECVVNAVCDSPSTRNESTNLCDCPSPNLGTDGADAPGDCDVPNADLCAAEDPPLYYNSETQSCDGRLYPCHESAVRLDDNSGCKCPPERPFSHGSPSGGSYDYAGNADIPASAICHAYSEHDPIMHGGGYGEWQSAVSENNPTLVAHFLNDHGSDPNEAGYYPLHEAAENDYHLVAWALIVGGAEVDRLDDSYGEAPLHRAVRLSVARMAAVLLDGGATPDLKDANEDAPLHLAARLSDTAANAGMISVLLSAGANPNLRNSGDLPPLDIAFQNGRRMLMAALIAGGANWGDPCTGGKIPNEHYRPADGTPQCACPSHSIANSKGVCECPSATHLTVNNVCLARDDGVAVTMAVLEMRAELEALRGALSSLNLRLAGELENPSLARGVLESVARQATLAAAEITRRRADLLALAEPNPGPKPQVGLSDTEAHCRMLNGRIQKFPSRGIFIDGDRTCSGVDKQGTFCIVGSSHAFPCRGLFKHVRVCNDVYHRPALNPFACAALCNADETARGKDCE